MCKGCYLKKLDDKVETGSGKKSRRVVAKSAENANNSMTKGMRDEERVMETCDHDDIKCFQNCSDWRWFTSKAWKEKGDYLDELCFKCGLPMLGDDPATK